MIQLENVSKIYSVNNAHYDALKEINFSVASGEIVGIVGASGAGKSTLLRVINLLERPNTGKVFVNGIDLMQLSARELKAKRRRMGMIFQHFNLLSSRTAFQNVALPLELMKASSKAIEETVNRLLSLVKLSDKAHHYPHQLSGGQKQRIGIARALATNPHLLLCDEPTSALDAQSTQAILALLKEINQTLDVTVVLITHELAVVKSICDRTYVIDHGKIVEEGSTLEIFAKPKMPVTQALVQSALHLSIPDKLKNKLKSESADSHACLVRFIFFDESSEFPLMSTLVKKFDVMINIIQANIETIQSVSMGFTVCEISGERFSEALDYAKETKVAMEILGYV